MFRRVALSARRKALRVMRTSSLMVREDFTAYVKL